MPFLIVYTCNLHLFLLRFPFLLSLIAFIVLNGNTFSSFCKPHIWFLLFHILNTWLILIRFDIDTHTNTNSKTTIHGLNPLLLLKTKRMTRCKKKGKKQKQKCWNCVCANVVSRLTKAAETHSWVHINHLLHHHHHHLWCKRQLKF